MFTEKPSSVSSDVVNIAAYKFVRLSELERRRDQMRTLTRNLGLKGTILLSPEGINLFLAGSRPQIGQFVHELRLDDAFRDIEVKESLSAHQPFQRMLVKIKREIIAFGVEGIDPEHATAPRVTPEVLKSWLDEGRRVTLLDTRNDYEVAVGTFDGAIDLGIGHFRQFPEAVRQLPSDLKREPIVMFCTGGIRCEKAGSYMQREGFENVYQLDGGILKYIEECGGAHWSGECFVFDHRVAVGTQLEETSTRQCFVCQAPLQAEELSSPLFEEGRSCPSCYEAPEQTRTRVLAERNSRLTELIDPLPGSRAGEQFHLLLVPAENDGWKVLDFLLSTGVGLGRDEWLQEITERRILLDDRPIDESCIVRKGQRFGRLVPLPLEPVVTGRPRIVYEDERFIVVEKPAAWPLRPGESLKRNTVAAVLRDVYAPLKPRPACDSDAVWSGLALFGKTRALARQIQREVVASHRLSIAVSGGDRQLTQLESIGLQLRARAVRPLDRGLTVFEGIGVDLAEVARTLGPLECLPAGCESSRETPLFHVMRFELGWRSSEEPVVLESGSNVLNVPDA